MTDKVNKQDAPDLPAQDDLCKCDHARSDHWSGYADCQAEVNGVACPCDDFEDYEANPDAPDVESAPKYDDSWSAEQKQAYADHMADVESGRPMSAEQKMCVCGHTASIHEWHDESSSCCRARVHLNGSFGVHGGTPCMCSGYSPTEQSQDPLPPPLHAFELRVVIGGNTWPFVLRAIADIARRIEETGENCGIASGGGGGCFSVDLARREISPDDYDRELIAWAEARRPGKAATQV